MALLAERGPSGFSMEGVAARAGVNKALPYRHFGNADAVLGELFLRFNQELGTRIVEAVAELAAPDDRVAATVGAFLDVAWEHRALLSVMNSPPADVADRMESELGAWQFIHALLTESFEVPEAATPAVAQLLLGILISSASAWHRGDAPRDELERLAVAACLGVVHASRG